MRRWTRSVFVALLSVAVFVQGDALWAQQRPLTVEELKTLAAGGVTEKRLLDLVKEKGIGFSLTAEVLERFAPRRCSRGSPEGDDSTGSTGPEGELLHRERVRTAFRG